MNSKFQFDSRWRFCWWLDSPVSITVGAKLQNQWLSGSWISQLLSHYCSLVTQDNPKASLRKLQKLFDEMRFVIITSNLLSYHPFYSIIMNHETNLTTGNLAYVFKS